MDPEKNPRAKDSGNRIHVCSCGKLTITDGGICTHRTRRKHGGMPKPLCFSPTSIKKMMEQLRNVKKREDRIEEEVGNDA